MNKYLSFSAEVRNALDKGLPVVALESTIISHGMPYPQNVQTASEVEEIIRRNGAVPATIGILGGFIKIGLIAEELEEFGSNPDVHKVSRRDLPYILASGKMGATTVAATMIAAQMASIRFFATGGIGGVHREGESTMDISADLTELSQTDVAVICAGVKSILDIGRTLEYLETQGVPVLGYKTAEFPSFYSRESGYNVDFQLDSPEACAALLLTKWDLNLKGGAVIANPVPAAHAMPREEIEAVILSALQEAEEKKVRGKEITPFLLARIKQITEGRSLETNIALVKHNAETAARIAAAYSRQKAVSLSS
ncbi:pseudouridine-5'-phosphate glycosidase [Peribacillus sp. SCS-37]|uniref:pseudouridine-5'-phosphate glycosidase n=1 Tax=Paraperibacillus esterisolvens TaxID=3115296 RepID=UPI003905A523